jgi:hypothetical protein
VCVKFTNGLSLLQDGDETSVLVVAIFVKQMERVCGSPFGIFFCTMSTVESVEYLPRLHDSTYRHIPFCSLLYCSVWLNTLMPSFLTSVLLCSINLNRFCCNADRRLDAKLSHLAGITAFRTIQKPNSSTFS